MGKEYHNIDLFFLPEAEETVQKNAPLYDPPQAETSEQQDIDVPSMSKTGPKPQNLISDSRACTTLQKQLTSTIVLDLKVDWEGPVHVAPRVQTPIAKLQLQSKVATPEILMDSKTYSEKRINDGQCVTDEKIVVKEHVDSESNIPDWKEPMFDLVDKSSFWAQSCIAILAYNK